MQQKKEMRANVRRLKKSYSAQQLSEMSEAVISSLMKDHHVSDADTIMLYYSLPDEVCTHNLVRKLVSLGKKILLPAVIDDENMELREYHDDSDLTVGAYDIMEPSGTLFTKYDEIDLAVVPGMMFDTKGNRLGRGKGYYDRFLKQIKNTYKIGLCFPFQVADNVPCELNDIPVDKVIC